MIGRTINNFQITALLGEGGMGAVYEARHRVIDRKIAIKVLKRELARDQEFLARFVNEAKAASSIRHPSIIEVFDVGLLEDQLAYLMMELLEGESLARRLRRVGRLSLEGALAITAQAASALTAAHGQDIVHRDLKPDNLFLLRDPAAPGGERVKVLDFGIAKLRPEVAGPDVRTQTGNILGTPAYMSPEQCRGMIADIDHRSDIYSLGIILYEMLCGDPPFTSTGQGDLLIRQATQAPRPPRQLNPAIPAAVNQAILRALEKAPSARFSSMAAFCQALGVGEPAVLRPAGSPATVVRAGDAQPEAPHTTLTSAASELRGRRRRGGGGPSLTWRRVVIAAVAGGSLGGAGVVGFRARNRAAHPPAAVGPAPERAAAVPAPPLPALRTQVVAPPPRNLSASPAPGTSAAGSKSPTEKSAGKTPVPGSDGPTVKPPVKRAPRSAGGKALRSGEPGETTPADGPSETQPESSAPAAAPKPRKPLVF